MKICISEWLRNDYPEVYASLCDALNQSNINYQVLARTKEVWARDYMPLHIGNGKYITFNFAPDYLVEKGSKYITNQKNVIQDIDLNVVAHLDIVLDGGNLVRCGDKTIMTDKERTWKCHSSEARRRRMTKRDTGSRIGSWDRERSFGGTPGTSKHSLCNTS